MLGGSEGECGVELLPVEGSERNMEQSGRKASLTAGRGLFLVEGARLFRARLLPSLEAPRLFRNNGARLSLPHVHGECGDDE